MVFEGPSTATTSAKFADLLAEQVLEPRFAEDDFARNRQDAPRLRDQDAARQRRRGARQAGAGRRVLYTDHPYGHPSQARWRPHRPSRSTTSASFYADALHARPPGRRRGRRLPGRFRARPSPSASRRCRPRPPPLPKLPPPPRPQGQPAADRGEGRARQRHLDRPPARHHPQRSRLLPAHGGALVPRRAPHVQRRADARTCASSAASTTATTRTSRTSSRTAGRTFPLPNIPRRQQHFEIWLRPVPPQNSLFALRAALFETDKLIREGIPEESASGHANLPRQLLQPLGPGRLAPPRLRHRRAWSPARTWSKSCRRACRR